MFKKLFKNLFTQKVNENNSKAKINTFYTDNGYKVYDGDEYLEWYEQIDKGQYKDYTNDLKYMFGMFRTAGLKPMILQDANTTQIYVTSLENINKEWDA